MSRFLLCMFILVSLLVPIATTQAFAEDADQLPFDWAGGIEDTFIPQSKPGLRPLEEYELTQHYQQWREDLDRAASLGITKLRWGVPWYKVEPQRGKFDWSWTDQVIPYMVNEKHIVPIIDLVHYGTPDWLDGSFTNPDYPAAVAEYEHAFAQRYGNLVDYYTPLNEPTVNAAMCGRNGVWPPYLKGEQGYVRVLSQIARGIQSSSKAIREADPSAKLVAVESMRLVRPVANGSEEEAQMEFLKDVLCFDLVAGRVNEDHPLYDYLLQNGATADTLKALLDNATLPDVLGVNFYPWAIRDVVADADKFTLKDGPKHGRMMLPMLKNVHEHAHLPLFITETSAPGSVTDRELWMSETIDAVRLARIRGIPVVGYTWFPIITMVEWEYRTDSKPVAEHLLHLGLWDSAFDDKGILVRHETPLVQNYRDWVHIGMPGCK